MSALRTSPASDGPAHDGKEVGKDSVKYEYKQVSVAPVSTHTFNHVRNKPISIPSYLIAIASGNVVYKPFAAVPDRPWKTGVWTEPEQMDAAYWEFSDDTAR